MCVRVYVHFEYNLNVSHPILEKIMGEQREVRWWRDIPVRTLGVAVVDKVKPGPGPGSHEQAPALPLQGS